MVEGAEVMSRPEPTPAAAASIAAIADGVAERFDVAVIAAWLESAGLEDVWLVIQRGKYKPIRRDVGFRLLGQNGGPVSTTDRTARRLSTTTVGAWWRLADLRCWLDQHPDPNKPNPKPPTKVSPWRHRGGFVSVEHAKKART
jgi:hypothetical protein